MISDKINDVCDCDSDIWTWEEWIALFKIGGIEVIRDGTNLHRHTNVVATAARQYILDCVLEEIEVEDQEPVEQEDLILKALKEAAQDVTTPEEIWYSEYKKLLKEGPVNLHLVAEDGEKIKIDVKLNLGNPPLMSTYIYSPNDVGGKLGWYAQSLQKGIKQYYVIIVNSSRDKAIVKMDLINKQYGLVNKIYIIKQHNNYLLAEISEF